MNETSVQTQTQFTRRDVILASVALSTFGLGLAQATAAVAQGSAGTPPASFGAAGTIAVERLDGGVLLLGIDRVHAENRLDPAILVALSTAYTQMESDDSLKVAVLYGKGSHFSMGVDVPAFAAGLAAGQLTPKNPQAINPFGLRPPFRSKPLVVAAQGGTKFGGHELFLSADIRVAASDAVFGQAEVTRGVFPAGGATVRFVREAGWANAMYHMLTGEEWGAEEARRLGLVQEIVPPGKQVDRAIEIARKIASAAPLGVKATLASAHHALAGEEPTLAALLSEFGQILQTEDAKEARRALQEGRAPVYRGR
jgi:enoyl-CoA hydratase